MSVAIPIVTEANAQALKEKEMEKEKEMMVENERINNGKKEITDIGAESKLPATPNIQNMIEEVVNGNHPEENVKASQPIPEYAHQSADEQGHLNQPNKSAADQQPHPQAQAQSPAQPQGQPQVPPQPSSPHLPQSPAEVRQSANLSGTNTPMKSTYSGGDAWTQLKNLQSLYDQGTSITVILAPSLS
jgi:hypothetical protein